MISTNCRFCNAPLIIFDTPEHTEDGETDPAIPADTKADLLKTFLTLAIKAIDEDDLPFATSVTITASGFAQSEMTELALHECPPTPSEKEQHNDR